MVKEATPTIECKEGIINVFCTYTALQDPQGLIPHPDNNNLHSKSQVKAMSTLLKANGWREAVVVSEKTGRIVSGHCRVLAAIEMGMPKVPVEVQHFENGIEEVKHLTAHNEIARQAKFDKLKFRETKTQIEGELEANEAQLVFFNPQEWGLPSYPQEKVADAKEPTLMLLQEGDEFQMGPHTLSLGKTTDKNEKIFQEVLKKFTKAQGVSAIHKATGKTYEDLMEERREELKKKNASKVVDLKKRKK